MSGCYENVNLAYQLTIYSLLPGKASQMSDKQNEEAKFSNDTIKVSNYQCY